MKRNGRSALSTAMACRDRAPARRVRERRLVWRRLGTLALGTLVLGCTGLPPAALEVPDTHVLVARPLTPATRPRRDLVVEVGPPRARPGFDTPQIVYVQRPYELDYFATHRWAATPARMLGPLVAQALDQSGSFSAVVRPPAPVRADLRVDVELVRLQQNFASRPSRVEIALRAELVDLQAKRVLASTLFEDTESAPTDDAYGGVTAANAAAARVLDKLVDFCIAEAGRR